LDEPAYSTADLPVAVGSLSLLDFISRYPALVEWTICGTVRGVVAAYLVYRAREALGDTDLPVLVDAWDGFPGAPTSGSSRASGTRAFSGG
jgi:hypothetical protein